jgi:hypothetical protein
MTKAAKKVEGNGAAAAGGGDILHFLTRTLQAHTFDAQPQDVMVKLESLKTALDRQEAALSDRPESPSRERIRAALADARNLIGKIVDDLETVPPGEAGPRDIKAPRALRR